MPAPVLASKVGCPRADLLVRGPVQSLVAQRAATPALVEELVYTVSDLGKGKGKITLAWENLSASVDVAAK